jgi:hypothetical protein
MFSRACYMSQFCPRFNRSKFKSASYEFGHIMLCILIPPHGQFSTKHLFSNIVSRSSLMVRQFHTLTRQLEMFRRWSLDSYHLQRLVTEVLAEIIQRSKSDRITVTTTKTSRFIFIINLTSLLHVSVSQGPSSGSYMNTNCH